MGLLKKERGTVFKDPGAKVRVCLVYPNEYKVGMSSLGFQGVYGLLNDIGEVYCERAFMPLSEDLGEHERTGTPVFSLETRTPLSAFDIIAFSVSFENDFPNVPRILGLSGVPMRHSERGPAHPLVIMGGVCAFSNPEPLAPFMDAVLVGEAEEILPEFMDAVLSQGGRDDLVSMLSCMEGIYVPGLYEVTYGSDGSIAGRRSAGSVPERVRRIYAKSISDPGVRARIWTPEAEFSSMVLAEAMRGCPWSCNFCLAGHVYDPPRHKSLDALKEEISLAAGEGVRVGLIGPSMTDYRHRDEVLGMDGVSFSITSLRATPGSARVVELIKDRKSVSIAPEAGSERLRRAVNKKVTREGILETAGRILEGGIKTLRLYFMVGLPGEGSGDVEAIVGLVREIRGLSKRGRVSVTLSVFVPKPFTPFQWQPMLPVKELQSRIRQVKDGLKGLGGVGVSAESPRLAHMQGLFARGDRRVSDVLEAMSAGSKWERACRGASIDPAWYTQRPRQWEENLPWDFIDAGVEWEDLWGRAERSLAGLGESGPGMAL
jgi:radical SAM superfamily enzyme YgiQ (UPF0313 family)